MKKEQFEAAVNSGDVDAVKHLLANTDIEDTKLDDLLLIAAHKDCKDIVELLLDLGANINCTDTTFHGYTPLMYAVCFEKIKVIELLLDRGANINCTDTLHGWTPLMIAGQFEKMEIIELLLDRGANINCTSTLYNYTPLMLAVQFGKMKVMKLLLDRGANVNCIGTMLGCTPLMHAAQFSKMEIVGLLLAYKADVNLANDDNDTALIMASELGSKQIAKALLDNGANVDHVGRSGKTALIIAFENRKEDVVWMLLKLAKHDLNLGNTKNIVHAVLEKAIQNSNFTLFSEIISRQFPNGIRSSDEIVKNKFRTYFCHARALFSDYYNIYFAMNKKLGVEETRENSDELLSALSINENELDAETILKKLPVMLHFKIMSYLINNPIADDAKRAATKAFNSYKNKDINNKSPKNTI